MSIFHVINHVVKKFEIEWRKLVESLSIAPNELASKLVGSQPGPSTFHTRVSSFQVLGSSTGIAVQFTQELATYNVLLFYEISQAVFINRMNPDCIIAVFILNYIEK